MYRKLLKLRNLFSPAWWLCKFDKRRVSILRTLIFNFHFLPFKQAIKLPILIYGKVKFSNLSGKVIIESGSIRVGMITIGGGTR